jgi:hypothetical protein
VLVSNMVQLDAAPGPQCVCGGIGFGVVQGTVRLNFQLAVRTSPFAFRPPFSLEAVGAGSFSTLGAARGLKLTVPERSATD